MNKPQLDSLTFATCVALILGACLPLLLFPDSSGKWLITAYNFIAAKLGFVYLAAGLGCILILLWLAFGRYGGIILGDSADEIEFNDSSWAAMLFCAGIGAGLMAWAPIEWGYYLNSPPFGVEAGSTQAAEWASTYGIFHWGITAWCFYCLPTIAIAYPYYVKKTRSLRFSNSCYHMLGGREDTGTGRLIDGLFMVGLLGGAGSSLGFSTPMIAALVARISGVETSFMLEFAIVLVSICLFSLSVWFGLRKGIKRLSDFNMWLAFLLLGFVLIAGPTTFMLKTSVNSLGLMFDNFVRMNSWTDPFTESRFVEDWTVFYWAWWIAYGPFVGLFVTRISRGRSIRQVIVGMLGYGSIGCALFYMTLGNYGLYLELTGAANVAATLAQDGAPAAIVMILETLPMAGFALAAYALIALVLSATTYDSASYILASSATRNMLAGEDPARWHRLFWALALAVLPLTLMFVGGLKVIQTATLVVSLPLVVVAVMMSVSLLKQLAADHPKA